MRDSRQPWALAGDEGQGIGEIVLAHEALEVGEGLLVGLGLLETPVYEEADVQAPEQAEDEQPVAAADAATVVVERHIQPLVASVLDVPAVTVGLEPLRGRQILRLQIGDQPDLLVLPALALFPDNVLTIGPAVVAAPDGQGRVGCPRLAVEQGLEGVPRHLRQAIVRRAVPPFLLPHKVANQNQPAGG